MVFSIGFANISLEWSFAPIRALRISLSLLNEAYRP
jgi:hypothetical protein